MSIFNRAAIQLKHAKELLKASEIIRQELQAELTETKDRLQHVQMERFAAQDQILTLTLQLKSLQIEVGDQSRSAIKKRSAPGNMMVRKEIATCSNHGISHKDSLDDFEWQSQEIELEEPRARLGVRWKVPVSASLNAV